MLLNITGILFAIQMVILLTLGPYADYGNWRPWIMISEYQAPEQAPCLTTSVFQVILQACQFAMCGLSKPGQWEIAQALYVLGSICKHTKLMWASLF